MRKSHSASAISSTSSGYTYGGSMSAIQQRRHSSANKIMRFRRDMKNADGNGGLLALMKFKERGIEQQEILNKMKSNIKAGKASRKKLSNKHAWLEEHNYLSSQRRDLEKDILILTRKYEMDLQEVSEVISKPVRRIHYTNRQELHSAMEDLAVEELTQSTEVRDISRSILVSNNISSKLQSISSIEQLLPGKIKLAVDSSYAKHIDETLIELFKQKIEEQLSQLRTRLQQQDQHFENQSFSDTLNRSVLSKASRPPTGNSDCGLSGCETATVSMSGTSTASESQRLSKIINSERVFGHKTRDSLTDKIQMEFPEWDLKTAQYQLWTYELRMFSKTRKRALIDEFDLNIGNILTALTSAVRQRSELIDSENRTAVLNAERERQQDARHKLLQKLRDEKRDRDATSLEQQLAESAELAAAQEELDRKRESEFNSRLRKLAEFKEQRAADEEKAALERDAAAVEDIRKHSILMKENKERVEYREQELTKKLHEIRAAKAQEEHEKQMRAAVLNTIAASVAPLVERDPNRVSKPTCSSSSVTDPQLINEAFVGQTRQNGFTDDQIVRDKRFQLTEALGQAGLLNTDYARKIIFSAAPKGPAVSGLQTTASNPLHVNYLPSSDVRDMGGR